MGIGNSVTVVVDAVDRTGSAMASAAKGEKTVGDAAAAAAKQLSQMDAKLADADAKARRLAAAAELSAIKTNDMTEKLAGLKRQLAESGDESGELGRKITRLSAETRVASLATDDYRRAAGRAANEAREQARAYDRVASEAAAAARAVTLFGAASRLGGGKGGAGGGFLGGLGDMGSGLLKGGLGTGSSAIGGVLGTPILGPAVLAGAAAAAIPAGAFLGGAAGGGILGGAGLAAAGGGLAGAWMDDPDKFDQMWSHSIDNVRTRWLNSSRAFGDELTGALKVADVTLKNLPVERVLGLSQSLVAPLAEGAGQGVTNLAAGLADGLEKVQPIVDNVGPKLASLGNAAGDAFRMISEGSEGGAQALGDFVTAAGYAIKATGLLILGLEKSYENIRSFGVGIRDAVRQSDFGPAAEGITSMLFDIRDSTMSATRSLGFAEGASRDTAFAWGEMAEAGAAAAMETLSLNDALTATRNTMLSMADANIAVAQGWIDLKDELADGAKTLDLNTQAGIDNQRAIVGQIELLERQRQQAIETGGGTVDAVNAANAAYDAQIEKLRQDAYAAGYNKQKVDELIASLGNVPKDTTANVRVPGLQESLRAGESLRQRLDAIDGRVAEAYVYVNYRSRGQSLNAALRTGGIKGAATGGPQNGLTEVGEEGPELVRLPTGSMVYPKANRNQMMAGGGPQRVLVELHLSGDGMAYELLHEAQRDGRFQILASAIVEA